MSPALQNTTIYSVFFAVELCSSIPPFLVFAFGNHRAFCPSTLVDPGYGLKRNVHLEIGSFKQAELQGLKNRGEKG